MKVNEIYDQASLFDFWSNNKALFTGLEKNKGILGRDSFVSLGGLNFSRYKALLCQSFNYTSSLASDKKIPYQLDAKCTKLFNISDNDLFDLHNTFIRQREYLISMTLDRFGEREVKSIDELINYHNEVIRIINSDSSLKDELDINVFGHRFFLPDLALYTYLVYNLDDKGIKKFGGYVDISSLTAWNQDLSWIFLKTLLNSNHKLAIYTNGTFLVNKQVKEERNIDMLIIDQYLSIAKKCVNLDEMKVTIKHRIKDYQTLYTDFSDMLDRIVSLENMKYLLSTDILGEQFKALGLLGQCLPYPKLYALHQFFNFLDLLIGEDNISDVLDISTIEGKDIILNSYIL